MALLNSLRSSLIAVTLVAAVLESGKMFSYYKLTLSAHQIVFSDLLMNYLYKQYTYKYVNFGNRACVYVYDRHYIMLE